MAIAQIAQLGARAAVAYGPQAYEYAKKQLAKVTSGKVTNESQLAKYVGNSPQRLKITTDALVTAGIPVDAVIPQDLVGTNEVLGRIRASAQALVSTMQSKFQAGSDTSLVQGEDGIVKDVIRKKRVATALRIFGSANAYFLVNPNGGIPAEDFVWYSRVILDR